MDKNKALNFFKDTQAERNRLVEASQKVDRDKLEESDFYKQRYLNTSYVDKVMHRVEKRVRGNTPMQNR